MRELARKSRGVFFIHPESVRAEVGELKLYAEVAGAKFAHDLLEGVLVLGGDADGVALDGGLGFELGVFDCGYDFLGIFAGDALLELDLLADGLARGLLDLLVFEVLEGDAALDQLLREDLDYGFEGVLVLAGKLDGLFLLEGDGGLGVLEVEARG